MAHSDIQKWFRTMPVKWAAESFARAAAVELGPYEITVNVISPGAVNTGWLPPEMEENLAKTYPLRRLGKPEDIANAVIFLASVQADWITGQVLYVGGGNRMLKVIAITGI